MQKPSAKGLIDKLKKLTKADNGEFKKRRKWYHVVFSIIAVIVVFCTVYSLILPAITLTTQSTGAETNSALSYLMYNNTTDTYRAYSEYSIEGISTNFSTFGIERTSIIYVYAFAGETICLGSDIVHSRIDENDNVLDDDSGADIVVIGPDGTKYSFDNDNESGLGYIGNTTKEKNGANYAGSGNKNGYTPHEFSVKSTGVYEIRFHSLDACNMTSKATTDVAEPHLKATSSLDPSPVKLTNDNWANTGSTIGAFDATVISDGKIKTGRAFADYLALNMGTNTNSKPSLYADFHILTSDGYIYRSKFNIDPYGFIFFANSRGNVDTETGYSAYRSVRARKQFSSTNEMDLTDMHYSVFTPQNEGTIFDKTYRIFFEEPAEDLLGILYQRAFAPKQVQNIEFIGSKEGNITYVGNGGYFKFDVENAVSVSLTVSFDEYNEQHGTNYENAVINANVTEGTNYIYWDGNDANGVVIPEGWYREGKITVSVNTHSGEIHFPFLDVENGFGLSFERVNDIYDYVDGVLTDVTEDYEDSKYTVYYNNTILPDKSNSPVQTIIADGVDASNGIDSENYVMSFKNGRGNFSILDIWTYAVAKQEATISTDIIIEDLDGYYTVNLNGLVSFDKDDSEYYDITGGDFPLDNVEVSLDYYYCGTRWENIVRDEETGQVTSLSPAAHRTTVENEDGSISEEIDYYYHSYEIRLEEDGQYHLYQYDSTDYYHTGAISPALDKNGNPIIVSIEEVEIPAEVVENETIDNFLVWIPIHRETTTDAIGEYFFSGVLVNDNFYNPPNEAVDEIVITVTNPNPDLYTVTTTNSVTGDFNTKGTETQIISLSDLYDMIRQDKGDTDKTNFFYSVADVGYYFDTYEPPLIVYKRWGTVDDSNDIESVTFKLQGYADSGDTRYICYERDVVVDYHSWMEELTDLPAKYTPPDSEEALDIQYRVVSETYIKSGTDTYIYTYHWDEAEPYSTYERVLTFDEDGNPLTTELLSANNYPYESYISPLEKTITNDYIYVENWTKATSSITINKFSAEDNTTRLKDATFLLEKKNDEGIFETVMTANGRYAVTTNENGVAVFRGLTEGTYRIVEISAPAHYEKISDIIFTIDENGEIDNGKITGDYDSGFSINLYDELSEAPVSKLVKYDQYGNTVSGATFAVYPADSNYNYSTTDDEGNPIEPVLTLTTGDDGSAIMYVEREDGTKREMYIAELTELLGGSDRFVLVETGVPDGYRGIGEAHLRIVGSGVNSYIICENPYESGVWANPNALVYATDTLQIKDMDQYYKIKNESYVDSTGAIQYTQFSSNGQISSNGTLFAVILKRNGAESDVDDIREITGDGWQPVYGDDVNGYHVVDDYDDTIEAVIDVAHRKYAVEFTASVDDNAMLTQTAYQIIASVDGNTILDTGKVKSSQMTGVPFGADVSSKTRIEWQVKLWDENDNEGEWSETAFFETAFLHSAEWKAKWISGNYKVNKKERYPVDCFKKCFNADKEVKSARLYVTACGLYEISINDRRVSMPLAPGITDYRLRVQYQTYDVTDCVKNGENVITAMLADGWYRGSCGAWGITNQYGTQTKLLAQLEVKYTDQTSDVIVTDNTWSWSNDGSILFADNKDGEIVDANKAPRYNGKALETSHNVVPTCSNNVPIAEKEQFKSEMTKSPSGKYILDFGQNFAGYISFKINAHKGDKITLRFGEMLVDGELSLKNIQCSNKKKTTPLQKIEYTCKEGVNEYKTRFAIFGFQYAEIETSIDINADDFTAYAVYSDMEEVGFFNSSNELLNKFVEATKWSTKSNSTDLPTDCPTRERHGWTGDAQIFYETAQYLFDYSAFSKKYITDMYDWQRKDGRLPQIVPYGGVDFYMWTMNGSVGWADAGVLMPYRFYKLLGDKQILVDYYGRMKRYAEFMISRVGKGPGIMSIYAKPVKIKSADKKYLVNCGQSYGEWAEPKDVYPNVWTDMVAPHPEVSTAYTVYIMEMMIDIARLTGNEQDAPHYKFYADNCRKSYQALMKTKDYDLDTDRQANLVRPLYMNLLDDEQTTYAKKRLIKALDNYGWRLGTGFLSTPFILNVLADIDIEYAYKLLENEEMPGWLFMSKMGATTIWESWEGTQAQGGIASLNHYSKGAVCEWLFKTMCGVNIDGENHFIIKPQPGGKFTNAGFTYKSIYGKVESSWERIDGKYKYTVTIPSNCTAEVILPNGISETITAGIYTFEG